jgi:hypothetical protein
MCVFTTKVSCTQSLCKHVKARKLLVLKVRNAQSPEAAGEAFVREDGSGRVHCWGGTETPVGSAGPSSHQIPCLLAASSCRQGCHVQAGNREKPMSPQPTHLQRCTQDPFVLWLPKVTLVGLIDFKANIKEKQKCRKEHLFLEHFWLLEFCLVCP